MRPLLDSHTLWFLRQPEKLSLMYFTTGRLWNGCGYEVPSDIRHIPASRVVRVFHHTNEPFVIVLCVSKRTPKSLGVTFRKLVCSDFGAIIAVPCSAQTNNGSQQKQLT